LNNAVKFTKDGKISISSTIHNRDFHLLISDSGPGFSESALENIRQLRNTLKNSSFLANFSEEGTQLGYQIIIELLRFLNGDFMIHSTKDKGSSIEIVLYNCLQE
jgi:signal transduction histidine kinase